MTEEGSVPGTGPAGAVSFGPFHLDLQAGQLRRDDVVVHLRPKTWEVLCFLVANAGRLVSKSDILAAVWGRTLVGDTMPSISVAELRRALDDDAKNPRFVETCHGRGFRFVAEVRPLSSASPIAQSAGDPVVLAGALFVGRREELAGLEALVSYGPGSCRFALVSGEAGIGKTTLVDRFVEGLHGASSSMRPWLVGRGQCLAQFGEGHPYLPVVGLLQDLSRSRSDIPTLLRTHAPSWLVRLPGLMTPQDAPGLREQTGDTNPGRIFDEMASLLQAIGPVVWILEDLHWADAATLELVALMIENSALDDFRIIGTVRLAEAVASSHGIARLRRELRRRDRCREIMLAGLTEYDIEQFLLARFPACTIPSWLPRRLESRTNGNAFFLTHMVEHLWDCGALPSQGACTAQQEVELELAVDAVPASLRELVREEVSALTDEERKTLEAASLSGLETEAATAAAGLDRSAAAVDALCADLERRSLLLTRIGETTWPNGVVSGRYRFRHALYQKVLYDDQPPASRREAHCRIGRTLASAYLERVPEVSAALAEHFERGGEPRKAVAYYEMAAREALRRHASREAAYHLRRALALLPSFPDGSARESAILAELGPILPALRGFGDPALLETYMRARSLQAVGSDASRELRTMFGLLLANLMQRRPQPAEDLANELLEMTANDSNAGNRACAEHLMGAVLYHRGDLNSTVAHADRALALAPEGVALGPMDLACSASVMSGAALWQAGCPDEGLARVLNGLEIARRSDPFNLVVALQTLAALCHWRGDAERALAAAGELEREALQQGIHEAKASASLTAAWALLEMGDRPAALDHVEKGLRELREHGSMMQSVYLLTIAVEVLAALEERDRAVELVADAEAMIEDGAARWWEPELYRWRAVLLRLARAHETDGEQEALLNRALELATLQGADSLALRAAHAIAELPQRAGHHRESTALLRDMLDRVRGGEDTRDMRDARGLLATAHARPRGLRPATEREGRR